MEEEWSEEESSGTSTIEILDETLSGDDLDESLISEPSTSKPTRRSTRTAVTSKLNTSNESEAQDSPYVEPEEPYEEWRAEDEWKPKPKGRRKKAPIARRRQKDKAESATARKTKSGTTSSKPRGRPKLSTKLKPPVHWEGEFDVYDEDKTPEREEEKVQMIVNQEDSEEVVLLEKEPEEIALERFELHGADADNLFEDDEQSEVHHYHEADQEHAEEEQGCRRSSKPFARALYGLPSDDDDATDSDRTLSPVDDGTQYHHGLQGSSESFDISEIERPSEHRALGSGAVVVDKMSSHHFQDDDENTQYSVEAELAQYAREDEMNARLDREMEEIGLGGGDMGLPRGVGFERSNIQALRLDDEDRENTPSAEPMEYEQDEAGPSGTYQEPTKGPEEGDLRDGYGYPQVVTFSTDDQQFFEGELVAIEGGDFEGQELGDQIFLTTSDNPDEIEYITEGMEYQQQSPRESIASTIEITMSQLCISGEVVEVPDLMLENESFFNHVLSEETFYSLTQAQQDHLKRFLPKSKAEDDHKKAISEALTPNPNYYFGSPLTRAFNRIRAGYFNVERPFDLIQLQDNRRVWYDHYIREYYMKLLKRLLLTRHAILEQAANIPEHMPIKINCAKYANIKRRDNQELIKFRARKRARMLINFAAEKTADDTASSDDSLDEDEELTKIPIKHEADGESTHFSPEYTDCDLDMYQPAKMKTIKDLLKEHKALKKKNPNCPSLDTSDITLEDVYERSGLSFQSERNFIQMPNPVAVLPPSVPKKKRSRPRKRVLTEITEELSETHQPLDPFDPNLEGFQQSQELGVE